MRIYVFLIISRYITQCDALFIQLIAKLMSLKIVALCFICLVIFGKTVFTAVPGRNSISLYKANDKLHILTSQNFSSNVYQSKTAWVVEFYASWCGHCQAYAKVLTL